MTRLSRNSSRRRMVSANEPGSRSRRMARARFLICPASAFPSRAAIIVLINAGPQSPAISRASSLTPASSKR